MRSDSQGRAVQVGRYLGSPTTLALGVTSANVQLAQNRHYRLWASVDAFFKFGASGVTATTNDHPLTAKLDTLHYTDEVNIFCAGIVSSGSGTLFISEVDPSGV